MADNVESNPGSGGAIWGTDEITGVHYPRIKLIFGDNNSSEGDVSSTNPLPVTAAQNGAWTVAATQSGAWTVSVTGTVSTSASQSGVWNVGITGDVNVTNSGTFAVQNTAAIPTGSNAIGKVDVTSVVPGTTSLSLGKAEDAIAGTGDTGVMMLAVRRDTDGSQVDADGDYAELQVDNEGRLKVVDKSFLDVVQYAEIDASASGDNTIATPSAGQTILVISYVIVAANEVVARWKGGAATNATGPMTLIKASGVSSGTNEWGHFKLPQDQPLVLNLSAAIQVSGHVTYAVT